VSRKLSFALHPKLPQQIERHHAVAGGTQELDVFAIIRIAHLVVDPHCRMKFGGRHYSRYLPM